MFAVSLVSVPARMQKLETKKIFFRSNLSKNNFVLVTQICEGHGKAQFSLTERKIFNRDIGYKINIICRCFVYFLYPSMSALSNPFFHLNHVENSEIF